MQNDLTILLRDGKRAARAGRLRYSSSGEPGITRRRRGRGFAYFTASGKRVSDAAQLARIKSLAIPPAWTNVWICSSVNGHLQATGRDARGRKQYRYHSRWRSVRDAAKYHQVIAFGEALPRVRARIRRDERLPGLPKERVVALIIDIMQVTRLRVGNDCYVEENRSFGLTTLCDRHARINGAVVRLKFKGKGGKPQNVLFSNARLAQIVKRCRDIPGQRLFQYQKSNGHHGSVTSSDVNAYLRRVTGRPFSAKDIRTFSATVLAATRLHGADRCRSQAHAKRVVKRAIEEVALELGNTSAICRRCYVHPAITQAYLGGQLHPMMDRAVQAARKKRPSDLTLDEAATLNFLKAGELAPAALAA